MRWMWGCGVPYHIWECLSYGTYWEISKVQWSCHLGMKNLWMFCYEGKGDKIVVIFNRYRNSKVVCVTC
jgi:hypothetical protein